MLDEESFAAFFRHAYPRLISFLVAHGANRADADDIAQESMIKIHERWSREDIEKPFPYVRRIAIRMLWRWGAVTARQAEPVPLEALAGLGGGGPDPADIGDAYQVAALIRDLPVAQGDVCALRYDGFTVGEIAAIVGKPENTVRSLLRHGRTHLAKMIESDSVINCGFDRDKRDSRPPEARATASRRHSRFKILSDGGHFKIESL